MCWSICQLAILSFGRFFGSRHSRPGIDSYRSAFRKNLATVDVGAQTAELTDEIVVAAVDVVGIGDLGDAVGHEAGDDHNAQRFGTHGGIVGTVALDLNVEGQRTRVDEVGQLTGFGQTAHTRDGGDTVGDVGADGGVGQHGNGSLCAGGIQVADDDGCAQISELLCDCTADAAACAGDNGNLAVEYGIFDYIHNGTCICTNIRGSICTI